MLTVTCSCTFALSLRFDCNVSIWRSNGLVAIPTWNSKSYHFVWKKWKEQNYHFVWKQNWDKPILPNPRVVCLIVLAFVASSRPEQIVCTMAMTITMTTMTMIMKTMTIKNDNIDNIGNSESNNVIDKDNSNSKNVIDNIGKTESNNGNTSCLWISSLLVADSSANLALAWELRTCNKFKFKKRKCLFAHSICANFGLNAHSPAYSITLYL